MLGAILLFLLVLIGFPLRAVSAMQGQLPPADTSHLCTNCRINTTRLLTFDTTNSAGHLGGPPISVVHGPKGLYIVTA